MVVRCNTNVPIEAAELKAMTEKAKKGGPLVCKPVLFKIGGVGFTDMCVGEWWRD